MMVQQNFKNILLCPVCKSAISETGEQVLSCANINCDSTYRIRNGVPDMLPEDGWLASGKIASAEPESGVAQTDAVNLETDFQQSKRKTGILEELYVEYSFAVRRQVMAEQCEILGRKLDVLDVGSGSLLRGTGGRGGRHFRMLKEYSRSYTALEPSWAMIDQVNQPDGNLFHLPAPSLVRGIGEMLPFHRERYDLVFFLSMLDHVINPQKVLTEAKSILRPTGQVLIILQNYQSWQRRVATRLMPSYMRKREAQDHHNWHFTPSTVLQLLKDSKYIVNFCTELGYLSVPRAQFIENMVFLLPIKLIGQKSGATLVSRIDAGLASLFPGAGGQFIISASRSEYL